MAVRSRRLFGPLATTTGGATVTYTVPSGRTAVIRSLFVTNIGTVDNEARLLLNSAAGTPRIWNGLVLARTTQIVGTLTLDPGDQLRFTVNTVGGSQVNWTGFGSLLLGAPE